MKLLIPLVLLTTLIAVDAASAATPVHRQIARNNAHRAVGRHTGRLIRASRMRVRVIPHHISALALASANASERAVPPTSDDAPILPGPDHPGFLRDHDHAGWGWNDGRSQTVMGLYHRNPRPDFVPNADLIQGGNGAAGLQMSFKFGG